MKRCPSTKKVAPIAVDELEHGIESTLEQVIALCIENVGEDFINQLVYTVKANLNRLANDCKRSLSEWPEVDRSFIDGIHEPEDAILLVQEFPNYNDGFSSASRALSKLLLWIPNDFKNIKFQLEEFKNDLAIIKSLMFKMRLFDLESNHTTKSIKSSRNGRKSVKDRRIKLKPRNHKIVTSAKELLENGDPHHSIVGKLSGRSWGGESLTPRQIREILKKEKIYPFQK